MRTHVTILGWLQILLGVLDILLALVVVGVLAGTGLLLGLEEGPAFTLWGGAAATIIGFIVFVTALPNLLAGIGLLGRKEWARILTLILAVLNAFKFPVGTALAVYTFWVLTGDETRRWFAGP